MELHSPGRRAASLEKLASIMELQPDGVAAGRQIIFVKPGDRGAPACYRLPLAVEGLPEEGWTVVETMHVNVWLNETVPDVIVELLPVQEKLQEFHQMWRCLFPVFQEALEAGGFPIHGALVERAGVGFLLAGSGGTGKSTCCSRLPAPWRSLCDDEALVIPDRDGQIPCPSTSNMERLHL